MNSSNQQNHTSFKGRMLPLPTTLAAALLLALTTAASFGDTVIVPPNSTPAAAYGKTYGQWAVAWWQWGLSVPAAVNPILDTTGANAGQGQSGPVWFLGGTFGGGGPINRTVTIPAGKAIFIPVYQWIFGATVGDCRPSHPGVRCQVPALRASAAAATTSVQSLKVTIDGQSVSDLPQYRADSPGGFSVTLPEGNVLQLFGLPDPAGTYAPQVADGYWLLLGPLAPGAHTISVAVTPDPNYGTPFQVTYNITVAADSGGAAEPTATPPKTVLARPIGNPT